ncbi:MAG: gamma-glutamylcyclotransferase family protein [Pirellulaceae bacterium]
MISRLVFVYGTLMRGQKRESCWPRSPVSVQAAVVQGALFDLGPYPALVPGLDWIIGELWELDAADVDITLRVLDEVEWYNQVPGEDLYIRTEVSAVRIWDNSLVKALTYHYADVGSLAGQAKSITPNALGFCQWRPLKEY